MAEQDSATLTGLTDSQKWLALALVAGFGYLVYLLAPILTPFAIAALFAYLGDPITDRLEGLGLKRTTAVVVVFLLLTVAAGTFVLILVPLLEGQIVQLVKRLPAIVDWLQQHVKTLAVKYFDTELKLPAGTEIVGMLKEHGQQVGSLAADVLSQLSKSGAAVLGWIMNLVLIPVVTFYLLRDWDVMVGRIRELLPGSAESTVVRLAAESNEVLGAFLRGQVAVMLALGVIYTVGLWIVGVDLALLIGMVAGMISFVPYLGTIVGVAAGVVAAMFQFQDVLHVVLVLVVFGTGQALEGMLLTPLLVGDRIGLHPVAVIFFVLAGGQLFGFLGILIALPAAAVLMVLIRYAHERYTQSGFYRDGRASADADDGEATESE